MKRLSLALCCCLFAGSVLAQSSNQSDSDFIQRAKKLREASLQAIEPQVVVPTTGRSRSSGTRVVMIGDSLSVGPFGESIGSYLDSRFGTGNVAVFASGGSSPQSWMRSEPDYVTKCGYRQQIPSGTTLIDFVNGKPPRRVTTPKIESIIAKYHPTTVIVQLGTNWMDGLAGNSGGDDYQHDSSTLDRFVAAVRSHPGENRQIIWITPPDSAKFSNRVQKAVETLIRDAAKKYSFEIVASRPMTHYVMGQSGGDGVHYNKDASEAWAKQVKRDLDRKLR
jgi:hypothetical protein